MIDLTITQIGRLVGSIRQLCETCHKIAIKSGWWDGEVNDGAIIAAMHSEISEGFEALRIPTQPSEHIPDFSGIEEEMADILIRVFDFCAARELDLSGALIAKMEYNKGRSYRHGGKTM